MKQLTVNQMEHTQGGILFFLAVFLSGVLVGAILTLVTEL